MTKILSHCTACNMPIIGETGLLGFCKSDVLPHTIRRTCNCRFPSTPENPQIVAFQERLTSLEYRTDKLLQERMENIAERLQAWAEVKFRHSK